MSVTNSTTPTLSGKVAVILVLLAVSCLRAQTIRTLKGHKGTISCLALSRDGKMMAAAQARMPVPPGSESISTNPIQEVGHRWEPWPART
jgi:hypothetical protein